MCGIVKKAAIQKCPFLPNISAPSGALSHIAWFNSSQNLVLALQRLWSWGEKAEAYPDSSTSTTKEQVSK